MTSPLVLRDAWLDELRHVRRRSPETINVTGHHVQAFCMWHPADKPPPRYNPVAVGSGGTGRDDEPVHIITPR